MIKIWCFIELNVNFPWTFKNGAVGHQAVHKVSLVYYPMPLETLCKSFEKQLWLQDFGHWFYILSMTLSISKQYLLEEPPALTPHNDPLTLKIGTLVLVPDPSEKGQKLWQLCQLLTNKGLSAHFGKTNRDYLGLFFPLLSVIWLSRKTEKNLQKCLSAV